MVLGLPLYITENKRIRKKNVIPIHKTNCSRANEPVTEEFAINTFRKKKSVWR